jgi:hypothetical protein
LRDATNSASHGQPLYPPMGWVSFAIRDGNLPIAVRLDGELTLSAS